MGLQMISSGFPLRSIGIPLYPVLPGDDFLQGSANVFERNRNEAGNWREVARLAAGAGILFDQFGVSVAVDGDTIVAGALGDALFRGSAYIFERNAGGSDN